MNLKQAIVKFGKKTLTQTNDWYQWREINPRKLPPGIVLPNGNQYAQNVALKQQLCAQYRNGNDATKISVSRYYIYDWGGVRRNSDEKIAQYSLAPPDVLINKGSDGIASWSKALCIRSPDTYAIYDARVAFSLNAIQIVAGVAEPLLYPLLNGQNKLINRGSSRIKVYANERNWIVAKHNDFYQRYNEVLKASANELNVGHYTIEMLLFSVAPALLSAAFPNEQF